jgi:hypothetical protein
MGQLILPIALISCPRCFRSLPVVIPSAAMAARIGFLPFMGTMRLKSLMKPHRLTRKWIGEIFRKSVLSAMIFYASNGNKPTLCFVKYEYDLR